MLILPSQSPHRIESAYTHKPLLIPSLYSKINDNFNKKYSAICIFIYKMSQSNMPPVTSVLITDRTFDKAMTLRLEKLSVFSCPLNLHSASSTECNKNNLTSLFSTGDLWFCKSNYIQKTLTQNQLIAILPELLRKLDLMHT